MTAQEQERQTTDVLRPDADAGVVVDSNTRPGQVRPISDRITDASALSGWRFLTVLDLGGTLLPGWGVATIVRLNQRLLALGLCHCEQLDDGLPDLTAALQALPRLIALNLAGLTAHVAITLAMAARKLQMLSVALAELDGAPPPMSTPPQPLRRRGRRAPPTRARAVGRSVGAGCARGGAPDAARV